MPRVVSLKTYKAKTPEGDRIVNPGDEFETDQGRADHYERHGMAIPVTALPRRYVTAPAAPNKAAVEGPFGSAGGGTGAGNAPSSSLADPAPEKPTSGGSAAKPRSSRSTGAGSSAPGRTSSTDATATGGARKPGAKPRRRSKASD